MSERAREYFNTFDRACNGTKDCITVKPTDYARAVAVGFEA